MDLMKNKYITGPVAKLLTNNAWTMEMLSTAQQGQLSRYKGIGPAKAKSIILEAQRLVNEAKLQEAQLHVEPKPEVNEEPAMSVRIRRLKDLNQ